MKWKKNVHEKNGTKLLETYSYLNNRGILLIELDDILKENGVEYKEVDYLKIYKKIVIDKDDQTYSEFLKLVNTFINLFKSQGYDEKSFSLLEQKADNQNNVFLKYRAKMFLSIMKPLFIEYQNKLVEKSEIDFNDMINLSTRSIKDGKVKFNYKYIIVDEYQDISVSRFKLIKAIKDQTNAVVMTVGDDWQSIYRFAGSDIDLFTSFSNYFGYTETLKIERTYRNSQELIDIAERFILKNPKQLKKKLISGKNQYNPLRILLYKDDVSDAVNMALDEIVKSGKSNEKVYILGRNNFDIESLENREDFIIKNREKIKNIICKKHPSLDIEFMTVHKSKGLESDNIIVMNMENKLSGFPNKIADDPILSLVLTKSDEYEYAEERRLLYVAMTRTKNTSFLLAPDGSKSIFIEELMAENNKLNYSKATIEDIISENPKCPRCKSGTLVLRSDENGKEFLGCSNFPRCDRTYNDIEILKDRLVCKLCNGYMVKREGRYGLFYGCSNYPICENTINVSHADSPKENSSNNRMKRIKQYPPDKRIPWADKGLRRNGKTKSRNW